MISPPTDSLYKFIALSGLAILAWGFTFSAPLEADLRVKEAELVAFTKTGKLEMDTYAAQNERLSKRQERLPERSKEWQDIDAQLTTLAIKMIKLEGELNVQETKAASISDELKRYQSLGPVARWGGCFMAVLGFFLWYVRIQRYLDLKAEKD
jgi:hypothetical protein